MRAPEDEVDAARAAVHDARQRACVAAEVERQVQRRHVREDLRGAGADGPLQHSTAQHTESTAQQAPVSAKLPATLWGPIYSFVFLH